MGTEQRTAAFTPPPIQVPPDQVNGVGRTSVSTAVTGRLGTGRLGDVPDRDGAVAGLSNEDEIHAAYRLYGAELYRFVLRGLGDPGAAQDVTQETFLKAWRHAERYDPDLSSLRVWLFGIARNTMIDHARATGARPWQARLVPPPDARELAGTTEDDTERLLDAWVVEEGLRRLTDHHREAIVQTHLRDRPYNKVAAKLGIPVGTLRSRVFYGLRALREAMDEMGVSL